MLAGRTVETAADRRASERPAQPEWDFRIVDQLDPLGQFVRQHRDERFAVIDVAVEGQPGPQQARLAHQLGNGGQVIDGWAHLELAEVHRRVRTVEQAADGLERLRVQRGDFAAVVVAETARAATDLLDLLHLELAILDAVEFLVGVEAQCVRRQVEAHAHRVGGDHDVRLAFAETPGLLAAYLRRKRAVDHRYALAGAFEHALEFQHQLAAERHQQRAGLQALQRGGVLGHLHWRQALGALHLQLVLAEFAERAQRRLDQRRAGHHQLRRMRADQRIDPGPAALRVGHHLHLVDHHHVPVLVPEAGKLLHGAAEVRGAFANDFLLAGDQRTGHAHRFDALLILQCHQT